MGMRGIGSLVENGNVAVSLFRSHSLLAADSRTLKGSHPAPAYRGNQKQVSQGHLFLIAGAQGRIRTCEARRRQIYSLMRLTTPPPAQNINDYYS